MESSKVQQTESKTVETPTPATIKSEAPGKIVAPSKQPSTGQQWQEWLEPVRDFLTRLSDYIGDFLANNQKLLLNLGLIFGAIVAVKITLAVLDAINDIPLLAPLFELVGFGYTAWFVYRYLWKESTREELKAEFESIKAQVVGKTSES